MRVSAIMALLFGVIICVFETLINWGQWQWWPWWLVDYVAGIILIFGGTLALRGKPLGHLILVAGWGFALGMMWMSLAGNIEQGTDPARAGRVAGHYITLITLAILWCLSGLLLALRGKPTNQSKL